jgi:ribosome recycling factor
MTKTVSKLSEDGKVAIRNVRRDALKQANINYLLAPLHGMQSLPGCTCAHLRNGYTPQSIKTVRATWVDCDFDCDLQVGKLKKDGDLSEDGAANLEKAIDGLTGDYVKQVEKLAKDKSDELTNI